MTNDRIFFLAILFALVIGAIVVIKLRQNTVKRYVEQVNKENQETQEFVIARLDSIEKLLADTSISASDLRHRSDSIFADLESRNVRGDLTPLIEDTRGYLDTEISKRRSV
jgi:TfoX/Sxy family transcriptional regulator of competence genes